MNHAGKIAAVALLTLALSGCVAGSADAAHAAASGPLVQFLLGLWHGFIAPVTLIGEILNKFFPHLLPWTVRLYETKDPSLAYHIGFYLGLVGSPVLVVHRYRYRRV